MPDPGTHSAALLKRSCQMPLRVVVTRPQNQTELTALLQSRGADALHIPLLAIEEMEETPQDRSRLLDLDHFNAVICISPNAARLFTDRMDMYWPQPPVEVYWFTPGQGSAAILEDFGLPVSWPGQGDNSEAMLEMPGLTDVSGKKILLCKGEGGRTLLKDTLVNRGASVSELILYRRTCPNLLSAERDILQFAELDVVIISSSDALDNLEQLTGLPAPLLDKTLLVSSPRLRQKARSIGFKRIVQAKGAGSRWQLAALESIASQS
ncbi:uroporphyrinogen-III synthase [Oceanospirillum sediminis]|uniref:Uroporphyrinogen-III synthase n=1 Tax=Oceanospirillum sediminis TaxID=2760088 RepID=A0A839IM02_9GAMM|nr:uroporphyrinogen-III synthase [Oceanospirillum sediminis]